MQLLPLYLVLATFLPISSHVNAHRNKGANEHEALTDLVRSAQLVMKTDSGNVLTRSSREAVQDLQTQAASTAGSETGSTNNRSKDNSKKSNKSTEHVASSRNSNNKYNQQGHKGNGKQQRQQERKPQPQHNRHRSRSKVAQKSNPVEAADPSPTPGKSPSTCRYAKSAWSDCNNETNLRTRTLTLKKGESSCLPTRTMQKKCKKACKYTKGAWSECNAGHMTREDKLKNLDGAVNHQTCDPVRTSRKKCIIGGSKSKQRMGNGSNDRKSKERSN